MKKSICFQGQERTTEQLKEALEFAGGILQSLGDGKTEFTLEYSKADGVSILTLQTLPRDSAKKPKPTSNPS
ncbi:MAG: hypothetical protein ACKO9Q_19085 [Pirellula sp.]